MIASTASGGSRPSFCSRPAIVAVSASRAKVGRHPAAMPPGGPRSSCSGAAVHTPPPRAAGLVMACGMPASTSQAPLLRQPRRHPAEAHFQRRPGWPLRLRQGLWGFHERLPDGPLLRGRWPLLHLELGRCIAPHESKEVFLIVPLLPSCHRRTRTTSEEPFHGKVKKNNCGFELKTLAFNS